MRASQGFYCPSFIQPNKKTNKPAEDIGTTTREVGGLFVANNFHQRGTNHKLNKVYQGSWTVHLNVFLAEKQHVFCSVPHIPPFLTIHVWQISVMAKFGMIFTLSMNFSVLLSNFEMKGPFQKVWYWNFLTFDCNSLYEATFHLPNVLHDFFLTNLNTRFLAPPGTP